MATAAAPMITRPLQAAAMMFLTGVRALVIPPGASSFCFYNFQLALPSIHLHLFSYQATPSCSVYLSLFWIFAYLLQHPADMLARFRGPDGTVRIAIEPTDTFRTLGKKVTTRPGLVCLIELC
jgi:hypothetical protein